MNIHPAVWNEFLVFAKVLYKLNKEAEIYDVFMMMRADQGTHPYNDNDPMIRDLDAQIAREERKRNAS